MKKIFLLFIAAMLLLSLVACGNSNANTESPASPPEAPDGEETKPETDTDPTEPGAEGKALVAYFSKTGNTETIAKMIAELTGAELFKIETVTPYPEDYNETVDIASDEQANDARPELSTHVENMEDYDTIYLGYPNWWGTMPMALFTFLEEYDFSGKTIIPFCTHGGSALGSSESDIASLAPDAVLLEGFAVRGTAAADAKTDVEAWLNGLN